MSLKPMAAADRERVDLLAEEFLERFRQGERPSITEYERGYPELAAEIRELFPTLVVLEQFGPRPDDPNSQPARSSPEAAPQRLGEYRILRELGRGGMGVVYEAVQESLGRHVALKVLPSHALLDAQRLKRFQHEAQAAAKLHHTNIVPVFGVGTEAGVHFYAMQFIEGRGLNDVIAELLRLKTSSTADASPSAGGRAGPKTDDDTPVAANLSTISDTPRYYRSVAKLGVQIADALEHAHRQGVLHRDIKPANLLLDALGTVWVTDFGLAKAAGMEELTQTGDVIGTLRYTAPERLRGEGDARADVYSLGLTLYELLALRPAFDAGDRIALVRQITQDEPPRLRKVDAKMPRDLETIVVKAIAKEPHRRYETAGELADDLRRFLGDRPIEARRTPWWEHAGRWCRRNPAIAGACAAAVAALVVGLGVSTWQWQRADRSRAQAQASASQAEQDFRMAFQAIDRMLTRAGVERLADVPHMTQSRRRLLADAVAFYEELLQSHGDRRGVRFEMARAQWRLGQIHSLLGDRTNAQANFEQALAATQRILHDDPTQVESRHLAASIHLYRGGMHEEYERPHDAEAEYRQAELLWDGLTRQFPDRPDFALNRAQASLRLGNSLRVSDPRQADSCVQKGVAIAETLLATHPQHEGVLDVLASGLHFLALLHLDQGRPTDAEKALRSVVELRSQRPAAEQDGDERGQLVTALLNLGRRLGAPHQRDEAEKLCLQAVQLSERLAEGFPDIAAYQNYLADALTQYGHCLKRAGRRDQAEAAYARAVVTSRALVEKHDTPVYHRQLCAGLNSLAQEVRNRGDAAAAQPLTEEAIRRLELVLKADPRDTSALTMLWQSSRTLTTILLLLGEVEASERFVERQLEFCDELTGLGTPSSALLFARGTAYQNLAQVETKANRQSAAEEAHREAIAIWRRLVATSPGNPEHASQLGADLNNLATLMRAPRRWSEMVTLLEEAVQHQESAMRAAPHHPTYRQFLQNHLTNLADARLGAGDYAQVPELKRQAQERLPELFNQFRWATYLARCIPLVQRDAGLAQEERDRQVQIYGDQAMALLRAAQEKKSPSLAQIRTHAALDPLRSREDFQSLLAELKDQPN